VENSKVSKRSVFNWGAMNHYFLLTIDVEDWFQVENFKQYIPFDSWPSYELRVEKNTHRILNLLDSIGIENTEYDSQKAASNGQGLSTDLCNASETGEANSDRRRVEVSQFPDENEKEKISGKSSKSCLTTPKATFFVLGWLAERLPHLVREIHSRGHEVASHGYYHNLCNEQSYEDLKNDLSNSKSLLEDIIGTQVYGYRAPSFAINNDILKIIEDCGYLYDSSFNSFSMHGRYGKISLNEQNRVGIVYKISSDFYEFPISNLKSKIQNLVLPWGGGGYFRLIPFPLFKLGVESILKKENAYLFYMHPWEIDADQPRVNDASTFYRFRHYSNLSKTHSKLLKLLQFHHL
jgi:polysaccharide deacetylase family protein (PEP-CTERM system associated)